MGSSSWGDNGFIRAFLFQQRLLLFGQRFGAPIVAIEIGVFDACPSGMIPANLQNLRVVDFMKRRVGWVMRFLEGVVAFRIVAANQCPAGFIGSIGG